MEHSTPLTVGVDIGKDHLDVCLHPGGMERRFTNDAKGHRTLIAWLTPHTVTRVVYEATGAYHRAFERTLAQADLPLAKVNPRQARRFAEATGQLAKTDRCDAAMLARLGALLEPPVRSVPTPVLATMRELHGARQALIKDRTAALNRQKQLTAALLKRHALQRLRQIKVQLDAIEAELDALCVADQDLVRRRAILASIPGIGEATAIALLIEMPELGSLEPGPAASLAGLAPMARDSGRSTGRRFIRGGGTHRTAPSPLHACPGRDPVQPRPQGEVSSASRCWKATKTRPHGRHAQAHSAGQCPPEGRPHLATKTRLSKTDTQAHDVRPRGLRAVTPAR